MIFDAKIFCLNRLFFIVKTAATSARGIIALLLITIMVMLFSCTTKQPDTVSSKRTNPVDTLMLAYQEEFFTDVKAGPHKQLDSLCQNIKLTDWQKAEYYYIKSYINKHYNFNPETVLAYADSILLVVAEHQNDPDFAEFNTNALFAKAEMHKILGNYRLAYNYFMDAKNSGKDRRDKSKENCINSTYDYHIGMILYMQEKYADAANSFISSYQSNMDCDSTMLVIFRREELLNNIGLCYTKLKMYDSALYYYNLSYNYMATLKNRWPTNYAFFDVAMGVISGNRAQVYYAMGDTTKAIAGLMHNISINLKYDRDIGDGLTSVVHLSDICLENNKIQEAGRWITIAQGVLDSMPNAVTQKNVYRQKWQYYKAQQRYDSAEKYALKYTTLKDSLLEKDKNLQNADVQATMNVLEKEFELNLLKKDVQTRKTYTTLITIAVILAVIIIVIILYGRGVLKKKNRMLELRNEENTEKNNELKKLNENKDRIMAIVAHDLRNPITAVYSLNNILQNYIPAENHEQHHVMGMIETSCNTALNLINEILLMSSMRHLDEKDLQKENVWLNEFLKTSVDLLQFKANEKNQKLQLVLPETDTQLLISSEKIRRALGNLVVNAIKFSKPGEIINIKAELKKNTVIITVRDNGMGIPTAMQTRVFDVFTDAKRLGTAGEKPFGLGLSISKQIIEAHRGKIWFESEEGKGTTFYVELQVA